MFFFFFLSEKIVPFHHLTSILLPLPAMGRHGPQILFITQPQLLEQFPSKTNLLTYIRRDSFHPKGQHLPWNQPGYKDDAGMTPRQRRAWTSGGLAHDWFPWGPRAGTVWQSPDSQSGRDSGSPPARPRTAGAGRVPHGTGADCGCDAPGQNQESRAPSKPSACTLIPERSYLLS